MVEYFKIVREIVLKVNQRATINKNTIGSFYTVKNSIEKYGADIQEIELGVLDDTVDYKKMIRQIILDLRFSQYTESMYGSAEDSRYDAYYLGDVARIVMEKTDEFNVGDVLEISPLNRDEYLDEIKKYNLV